MSKYHNKDVDDEERLRKQAEEHDRKLVMIKSNLRDEEKVENQAIYIVRDLEMREDEGMEQELEAVEGQLNDKVVAERMQAIQEHLQSEKIDTIVNELKEKVIRELNVENKIKQAQSISK